MRHGCDEWLGYGWLLASGLIAAPAGAAQVSAIELLGQAQIPHHQIYADTPVGGLSGLAWLPDSNQFLVVSDDRSERAPARFYTVHVTLAEGRLTDGGVVFDAMTTLQNEAGQPYPATTIDPEGIAVDADDLVYVSSEGDVKRQIAPFIHAYDRDGHFHHALPVPETFWPSTLLSRVTLGIRDNDAFETLTETPDRQTLFAATESALKQDGEEADVNHGSPARILQYDLVQRTLVHEYRYDIDPVLPPADQPSKSGSIGISDMLAIDKAGHLLAMERSYIKGVGNRIRLYTVTLDGATDIRDRDSIRNDASVVPVTKHLLADLGELPGMTLDNFEGLALGPTLGDGRRLLLVVSDDNFSKHQRTLFTAFAVTLTP